MPINHCDQHAVAGAIAQQALDMAENGFVAAFAHPIGTAIFKRFSGSFVELLGNRMLNLLFELPRCCNQKWAHRHRCAHFRHLDFVPD